MASPKYIYIIQDLITKEIKDEIPLSTVSFNAVLNGSASLTATMPMESPRGSLNRVTYGNLDAARTLVWVLSDGVPVWGGILWDVVTDLTSRMVTIECMDVWSYFYRRLITYDYAFNDVDLFDLVDTLVANAQAATSGDIDMRVGFDTTSSSFTSKIYQADMYTVGAYVDNLLRWNVFEYAVDVSGSMDSELISTFQMTRHKRGDDRGLVLDSSKNIELLSHKRIGSDMIDRVYVHSTSGDSKIITQRSSSYIGAYPLLERAYADADNTDINILEFIADQQVQKNLFPTDIIECVVDARDNDISIGSFIVGDQVTVVADYGILDINRAYRIATYTVDIDENGRSQISFKLVDARQFATNQGQVS